MAIKIKKPAPLAPNVENPEDGDVLEGEIINARPVDTVAGVDSVDRVVVASENAFDWLQRNAKFVVAGVAVVVIGVGAAATLSAAVTKQRGDDSQDLYRAYMQTIAPVGDVSEQPELWATGDPLFENVNARLLAARDVAEKTTSSTTKGASAFANLLAASARLGLGGDTTPATAEVRQFVKHAETPLQRTVGAFALATALAAEGDMAGALAQLDDIATKQPSMGIVVAAQRASLIDAYGTPDAALTAWADAAALAEGSPAESRYLARVAQLNILAGNAAGVGSEPAAQDADQDSP